ncbi:MAG: HAD family hydrolase [Flavobacteriales bacterium]
MDIKVDQNTIIVFDLDDTLYNEIEFLKSAYMNIAQELDKENWQGLYVHMLSLYRNRLDVFDFIEQRYRVPKENLLSAYRDHKPNIKLFNGALETLQRIKKNNGKIGLITDGRKKTQTNKIKALGLQPYLDCTVISEEIGTEKPHLNNYKHMEETFGKGSYHYIADNVKKDFLTPNAIGWNTIGLIDNGLNIHNEAHLYTEKKHQPKGYITSFLELNII